MNSNAAIADSQWCLGQIAGPTEPEEVVAVDGPTLHKGMLWLAGALKVRKHCAGALFAYGFAIVQ